MAEIEFNLNKLNNYPSKSINLKFKIISLEIYIVFVNQIIEFELYKYKLKIFTFLNNFEI